MTALLKYMPSNFTTRWSTYFSKHCPPNTNEIQFDEKWDFVRKKEKNRDENNPADLRCVVRTVFVVLAVRRCRRDSATTFGRSVSRSPSRLANNHRHKGSFTRKEKSLLERLQRHLSSDVDAQKLVELQSILRRRTMEGMERREGFLSSDYLMMAAYFAALIPAFLLFPFAQYLVAVGYPLIWLVLIALCALFVALGRTLNRFVQRWNNRRLDRFIETMVQYRPSVRRRISKIQSPPFRLLFSVVRNRRLRLLDSPLSTLNFPRIP